MSLERWERHGIGTWKGPERERLALKAKVEIDRKGDLEVHLMFEPDSVQWVVTLRHDRRKPILADAPSQTASLLQVFLAVLKKAC